MTRGIYSGFQPPLNIAAAIEHTAIVFADDAVISYKAGHCNIVYRSFEEKMQYLPD
jgi:hypothetical protein